MILEELIAKLTNGAAHLFLYDENGEFVLETIWYNTIPSEYLNRKIDWDRYDEYNITVLML